jgi:hypothetical protein
MFVGRDRKKQKRLLIDARPYIAIGIVANTQLGAVIIGVNGGPRIERTPAYLGGYSTYSQSLTLLPGLVPRDQSVASVSRRHTASRSSCVPFVPSR